MVSTSGTVSTTVFKTYKIVDHAFRRCRMAPEEITPQHLQTALDCLFLNFSKMANRGIPLWTIQRYILPLYQGQYQVDCPVGTVDTLNVALRTLLRLTGTYTASEGDASLAFDGDVKTSCTQTTPGGNIAIEFDGTTNISNVGILFNSTVAALSFVIETTSDGSTWNTVYTNDAYASVQGEWLWVDLDSPTTALISGYQNDITACRIRAIAPSILNIDEFFLSNTPQEIPMANINKDDYANLPNHNFQGRPVQWWYNIQLSPPQMWIWPAANAAANFQQLILYSHRQIQDVGTLNQLIEFPTRWYDAAIWDLAMILCDEIKEVPPGRKEEIRTDAEKSITEAWNQETDRSPIYLRVNISPYTR